MARYVSKFSSIPDERVGSDAVTRTEMNALLKVPENRPLCEEMLRKAFESEKNPASKQPYSARAWRRAALVLAEAPMNLFSKEGEEILSHKHEVIGMPVFGNTTEAAWQFVEAVLMRRELRADSNRVFPPEWRDGMLEDDVRMMAAFDILVAMETFNTDILGMRYTNNLYSIAYNYYTRYTLNERNEMLRTIETLMGVDEDWD